MKLLSNYDLSSILRSPDEPAAPAADAPEPALVADPAPAADAPEPAADEPAADPAPAAVVPPAPKAEVPKWALERIGEETSKRQAAETQARAAAQRAQDAEELARRLQAKETAPAADTTARRTETAAAPDTAVEAKAAELLFQRDLQTVSQAGASAYGQKWDQAVKALDAYGANSLEFVANVMDIDRSKAHDIMFEIAQDGEKAVALARMTPTRRIAEITRMIMAQAAPAADTKTEPEPKAEPKSAISKAPAPKPAIAGRAPEPEVNPMTPEGDAKMSDAQFESWYKAKYWKKTA
jgi:hypothetical protein